jgi:hypothetical protein
MYIDKCLEGGMIGMICCMKKKNIYIYIYKYIVELEKWHVFMLWNKTNLFAKNWTCKLESVNEL